MNSTEASLDELFALAQRACVEGSSTEDWEPACVRLVEFIRQHPDCREEAERRFIATLTTPALRWELVTFCMHALRMESVGDAARRLIAEHQDPRQSWLSDVVASLEDDWEDADMYESYRR